MLNKKKKLTEFQEKVVSSFGEKNTDVDIVVIYTRVYGDPGTLTARECLMKLAPTFAEINERSLSLHIEPGDLRRTYRCSTPRG